jgi:MoaA/NifB/PqqE/SkfB family radical SAM enzyme
MLPRLPLEGQIDLTYRCNNKCRHCWLWLSPNDKVTKKELSFDEICGLVDEARKLGCQRWSISGGEPMLRPDFPQIFDYLTKKAVSYTLNTNGTLITPAIARLLKRKGSKLIALYGATPEVYDHITRAPRSFAALMRGIAYLKEAGAGFMVQLIPVKGNYHQYKEMVKLALSLSPYYRVGAPWLFLSASGSAQRNREILDQRLSPAVVVELDQPDMSAGENLESSTKAALCLNGKQNEDDRLFASCLANRRDFHVDPYGGISFCSLVKDPSLRYDWRQGSFREAWEQFIPSLADAVRGGKEYWENCGSCSKRTECRWCAVYGFLEYHRFSAPIKYLCQVADENDMYKNNWEREHRRFFRIAGIPIQIDADLPISGKTFASKFKKFQIDSESKISNTVAIIHHFSLPDLHGRDLGEEVYRKPPWAIFRKGRSWIYLGIAPDPRSRSYHQVAVFNDDHSRGRIYQRDGKVFQKGNLHSLSLFPTDQIWLARVLAERQGCFIHSAGMKISGQGLLFAGHSEAGKSTTVTLLQNEGEILCDDRIIVRRRPKGFRIYGTWSHGDVPHVSAADAPLRAILFLEKAKTNRLVLIEDPKETLKRLLPLIIKPLITADWWEKTLIVIEKLIREVPAYRLQFDKSDKIKGILRGLVADQKKENKSNRKNRLL